MCAYFIIVGASSCSPGLILVFCSLLFCSSYFRRALTTMAEATLVRIVWASGMLILSECGQKLFGNGEVSCNLSIDVLLLLVLYFVSCHTSVLVVESGLVLLLVALLLEA